MKRIEVYAVGILLALVPAVFGLWGNASFSKDVPVRVPDQARTTATKVQPDTRALVAADRAGRTPVERHHARHGGDDPATHDVNDDHGGDRSGDNGGHRSGGNGDDRAVATSGGGADGGGGGADDPATHDVGDDHGGATAGVRHGGVDDTTTGHHHGGDNGSGSGTSGGGSGSGTSGGGSGDKESGGHGSDD